MTNKLGEFKVSLEKLFTKIQLKNFRGVNNAQSIGNVYFLNQILPKVDIILTNKLHFQCRTLSGFSRRCGWNEDVEG